MTREQVEWAMKNVELENYTIPDDLKKDMEKVIKGEKTIDQIVEETLRKYKNVR